MPLAERIGWHRAQLGRGVLASSASVSITHLPWGQSSPFHIFEVEQIFIVLKGEVEFSVGLDRDHLEPFRMSRFDRLYIPTKMGYGYTNVGSEDAEFVSVPCRVGDQWPGYSTYWLPGENEPLVYPHPQRTGGK
jgi:quercetin dioxygenase-like cupin family protein